MPLSVYFFVFLLLCVWCTVKVIGFLKQLALWLSAYFKLLTDGLCDQHFVGNLYLVTEQGVKLIFTEGLMSIMML